MLGKLTATAVWVLAAVHALSLAAEKPASKVDKARLEQFIRYTEGYTPVVKIDIGDPEPSSFKGMDRLPVHLSMGAQKIDKVYFVSPDGQIVNGSVWNLQESPFLDILQHLPRNGPGFGPTTAKVTLVVFSDFQCPYCREFAKTVREEIPKKYPNDVRIEFQDFPIASIHKWALPAAEAAHCVGAGNANAFWAFHDWLFGHQEEVNADNVKEKAVSFAKTQGLDGAAVGACIDNHGGAAEVKEGLQAGQELGVQQTPTSFINGRMVGGALKPGDLDAIVQLELNRPPQVPGPPQGKGPDAKMLKP